MTQMTLQTLAVDTAMTMSLLKALLALALILIWGKWATIVDKDADYYYLPRQMWNLIQIGTFTVAMLALLFIPIFIAGFVVAIAIIFGTGAYYVMTRNKVVPENMKWHFGKEMLNEFIMVKKQSKAVKEATIQFSPHGSPKTPPLPNDPNYDAHIALEDILGPALEKNAQRIEFNGGGSGSFAVQVIIDNRAYKQKSLSAKDGQNILKYLQSESSVHGEDNSRKVEGETGVYDKETGEHKLDFNIISSSKGIQAVINIDRIQRMNIPYDSLGLLDQQKAKLDEIFNSPKRAVLVTSPPKHGRTTTIYSLLAHHDPYTLDIHSFEPQIDMEVEGVTQHVVANDDIPAQMKSLLLQEPNVIGVTSVSSEEAAKCVANAASGAASGMAHRIYVGMPAKDPFGALRTWIKAVGDINLAADSLEAIINQRLIRKLCMTCKTAYKPEADSLKKMNLPADKISKLYKSSGKIQVKNEMQPCPACKGMGYLGLDAVFEVLVLDDEARNLIKSKQLEPLKQYLRKQKTIWMQEAALSKIAKGTTSISEVSETINNQS